MCLLMHCTQSIQQKLDRTLVYAITTECPYIYFLQQHYASPHIYVLSHSVLSMHNAGLVCMSLLFPHQLNLG